MSEEPEHSFRLDERARSFGYAGAGVLLLVRTQHNAWIHALATVAVVIAGLFFGVSRLEWCALVLAITLVWSAEGLNSAIELLADAVIPEQHPGVGRAKDVAAGAVLLTAVGAAVVGAIVFLPHLRAWWGALGS